MKRINIIYWIFTSLLALQVAAAGFMYFISPEVATGFAHLGFPDYFRQELGVAKVLAAVLLVLPMVPMRLKEWVYAGLASLRFTARTDTDRYLARRLRKEAWIDSGTIAFMGPSPRHRQSMVRTSWAPQPSITPYRALW